MCRTHPGLAEIPAPEYYSGILSKEQTKKVKGAVHILGKICPRSDTDIAHMEYSMDPLKFIPRGIWFWITWIFPC